MRQRFTLDFGRLGSAGFQVQQNPSFADLTGCTLYIDAYHHAMRFTWDETKRLANINKHGLDFADAEQVFAGPLMLIEDKRRDYGEQRMIGIGLLGFLVVLIVHVESEQDIRVIPMRKATSDETDLFFQNAGYF